MNWQSISKTSAYLFFLSVIMVLLVVLPLHTRSSSSNQPDPRLKWNARLYPKNKDFVEVILDTRDFPPFTCLDRISVKVGFLDRRGQEVQSKKFTLREEVKQGGVYATWFPHGLPSTDAAKGKRVDYVYFNCGIEATPVPCEESVMDRILNRQPECEKKDHRVRLNLTSGSSEEQEKIKLSPGEQVEHLQKRPEPKVP